MFGQSLFSAQYRELFEKLTKSCESTDVIYE